MKIKHKFFIIFIAALLLVLAANYFHFQTNFQDNLNGYEEIIVENDINAVQSMINEELQRLENTSVDWAIWDDTYEYVTGNNAAYLERNMYAESIEAINIDTVIIYDKNDKPVYARSYADGKTMPLTEVENKLFTDNRAALCRDSNLETPVTGLIADDSIYLVASSGISDSLTTEAKAGTLVFARKLDSSILTYFERTIGSEIRFFDVTTVDPTLAAYAKNANIQGNVTGTLDGDRDVGFTSLKDVSGDARIGLAVYVGSLDAVAADSTRILILSISLSVVFIFMLFYYLFRRYITEPIGQIVEHLEKIDTSGASGYSALEVKGTDEFSRIRKGINKLFKGLTDSINTFAKYFDLAGSLIIVLDPEGNVIKANRVCCEILGVDEDEIIGKNWTESFVPERSKGYIKKVISDLVSSEIPNAERIENHIVTSAGQERLITWHNAVLYDNDNRVTSIIASGEDITEKRSVHVMVAQSAQRLKKAEEIAHIGSWDMNMKTGEVMWSDEFYRLCGYKPGAVEPSFRRFIGRIHPEDRQRFEKLFNRAAHHRSSFETKMRIVRPDGEVLWVLSKGVMDRGETDTLMGSILDITGINEAEKQIRQNAELSENLVRILQYNAESIPDLLEYALNESVKLTESRIGYIFFYDEEKRDFELKVWSKEVMDECPIESKSKYRLDETGLWGDAVRQRRAIVINDYSAPNPDKKGYPEGHMPIKKFLTVPTFSNDRIVAVMGVANKETDYTQTDILKLTLVMNSVWEVVERIKTDILLKEERERLRITLLSVGDGVISTDRNGNIEMINEVAQKLTGWSRLDAIGKPFDEVFQIFNEFTREKCESPVQQVLMTGSIIELRNHTILRARDGSERPVADSAAPILDEAGTIHGVVMVFRDFTDEKRKKDEIEYLSYHDQLTGVYNRRYYEEELKYMNKEENLPLAVIMGDVNGLKLTNDAFGHAVGDKLLQAAANVLRLTCREDDIVARVGGDEFIILLPRTGAMEAESIVNRIRKAISTVEVDSVMLSISFGWDVKVDMDESIGDVLKKAEDNMYTCKLFESPSMRGQTVYTIINTLHEKDIREKNHSERVSRLCEMMGYALAMNEKGVKELKTAGLLHDIGKVAIPEKVLNKVGRLTKDEWEEIRRHPEIGYRILGAVNDMTDLANFVLAHHERWDGTGYPKGLAGEAIPLQSRIISIADAYDAMTKERPYRSALDEKVARNEILKNAGTQFDPNLARLFVEKVLRFKKNQHQLYELATDTQAGCVPDSDIDTAGVDVK